MLLSFFLLRLDLHLYLTISRKCRSILVCASILIRFQLCYDGLSLCICDCLNNALADKRRCYGFLTTYLPGRHDALQLFQTPFIRQTARETSPNNREREYSSARLCFEGIRGKKSFRSENSGIEKRGLSRAFKVLPMPESQLRNRRW